MNIRHGNSLQVLKTLPDKSVQCCVTSPPYWGLRDYGMEGQLGLEPTYQEYIANLIEIFNEVKRILKPDGTCFVNLGDTYGGSNSGKIEDNKAAKKGTGATSLNQDRPQSKLPSKTLLQIPNRFAIAMTDNGWILRNEIIWHKPNAMPSSAKDRFTVDFEKMFFFVKSKKYYFQQQLEPYCEPINRWGGENVKRLNGSDNYGMAQRIRNYRPVKAGKNKRCVWSINTKPFKEAHFATFPLELIEPCILAGSKEGDIVLDPFNGAGTTGVMCKKTNRDYIGIELNPEYIKLSENRIINTHF